MAIKKIPITVYSSNGSVNDDYAWYNNCGERLTSTNKHESPGEGYTCGVQPSNVKAVYAKLAQYIKDGNAVAFSELLQVNFIYPGRVSHYESGGHQFADGWYEENRETYKARPNIEALLVDDIDNFERLVDALIEKNDPELYRAFAERLDAVGLKDLFLWDSALQSKISSHLDRLKEYGRQLYTNIDEDAHDRGSKAKELAESISRKVWTHPINEGRDYLTQFQNLKFKLQIVRELHSEDDEFKAHRGWKRVIANLCSILLTAGIANAVNYGLTGNALFFNKTTTQTKVSDAQAAMGFDPKEDIKFNPR